jgi:hypothetical protein
MKKLICCLLSLCFSNFAVAAELNIGGPLTCRINGNGTGYWAALSTTGTGSNRPIDAGPNLIASYLSVPALAFEAMRGIHVWDDATTNGHNGPKGAFGYWGSQVASDCPDLTGTSYTVGGINFYTDGATCNHITSYQGAPSQPLAITVRTDSGSAGGIIYNGFFTWYVGTGLPLDAPPVGAIDVQRVTSHETGHLLGLGHMQLRHSTGTQPFLRVCDNASNSNDIQCNGRVYGGNSGSLDQYGIYTADYGENIGSLVPTMTQGSPSSILCTRSLADGDRTSAVRDYPVMSWPALYP